MDNRIVTEEKLEEDNDIANIRPETLVDYIGQTEVKRKFSNFYKSG